MISYQSLLLSTIVLNDNGCVYIALFALQKAGVVIIIAVLLLVGTVTNVMYASANTNIMKSVMVIMSHDHSIFTTSEDKELYNALRRVRNAEVVTAVSP